MGRRRGRIGGGKEQGIRNIIGRQEIHWEEVNSIGNREAKELVCMIHANKLREVGMLEHGGLQSTGRIKGRKKLGQA